MRRLGMLLLLSLLSFSLTFAQDTAAGWKLTSVQSLQEIVGDAFNPTALPLLAPDGSAVAWDAGSQNGLVVYNFDDQQLTVYPWPDTFRGFGRYSGLSWSPDARYLTFTESVFDLAYESDVWMLDRESGTFVDRTDDGLYGGLLKVEAPFAVDYLPTWNPANGDLYFFRSERLESGNTTALYLLPVERDEPKLVYDFTAETPVMSIFFPTAISPDGSILAYFVMGQDLKDARNGLWTFDLRTNTSQQIATPDDFRTGLPTWQEESGLIPKVPLWVGNNALVILSEDLQFGQGIAQTASYVDLAAQTVTPLVNFDDVIEERDFYVEEGPQSPIYRLPRSGFVAPDGSAFFFLRHGFRPDAGGISAVTLPPDGSTPVVLGEIENFSVYPSSYALPVMGTNGRALLYGFVFEFTKS
jgi:hypothetical protein